MKKLQINIFKKLLFNIFIIILKYKMEVKKYIFSYIFNLNIIINNK